jgi:hypothetical protein
LYCRVTRLLRGACRNEDFASASGDSKQSNAVPEVTAPSLGLNGKTLSELQGKCDVGLIREPKVSVRLLERFFYSLQLEFDRDETLV